VTAELDRADAVIVIFGAAVRPDGSASAALRHRVQAAAAFGATRSAPVFLPTGAVGRYGPSEASVMAALLCDYGVPAERIILEETGTDTLSSVRAVVRLCRSRFAHVPVFASEPVLAGAGGLDIVEAVVLALAGNAGDPVRCSPYDRRALAGPMAVTAAISLSPASPACPPWR
jgi:DUF218 domain